jgi:hypothetical protein
MASAANLGCCAACRIYWRSPRLGAKMSLPGLGIERLIGDLSCLARMPKWMSQAHVPCLAWKVAHAAVPENVAGAGRPTWFLAARVFQWVNPRAWMMALGGVRPF